MKSRILLSILFIAFSFSCSEEKLTPSFAEDVKVIKEAAKLNAYLFTVNFSKRQGLILIPSREEILNSFVNGYQTKYNFIDREMNKKLLNISLKTNEEIKANLSPRMSKYYDQTIGIFSKENLIKQINVSEINGRTNNAEVDGLIAYGREQLSLLEGYITNDTQLSYDEKISMLSSTSLLYEILPTLVGQPYGEGGSPIAIQRVAGWDWLKKSVNWIATIVVNVVQGIFSPVTLGALFFFAPLGAAGWALAIGAGATYGLVQGVDCIRSGTCVNCVFYVDDPNDPCH